MGWREQLENIAGGRRTVQLTVHLAPDDALRALRDYLVSDGKYNATVETEGILEVEDRSGANPGLGGCILIFVLVTISFGLALVLVLLWAFTKFRRLRIEAISPESEGTRLTLSGYPQQAVTEAEDWIRANLPTSNQS